MDAVLNIDNLKISFDDGIEKTQVLHGVSLDLKKGEILGLVGESGSGKSLTCLAVMRLLPSNALVDGSIDYDGQDIFALKAEKMHELRGSRIAMIFQDPTGALNPVQTIGRQLREAVKINSTEKPLSSGRGRGQTQTLALLKEVGIPDPEQMLKKYPHQLSGGQNQRIMIAMMLAGNPDLLIADEPSTALDVTIQAQILRLLKRLCTERNMAIILVTHDLGVVAKICDRMAVMYCGRIVESGPVAKIFSRPCHHYTCGLLNSMPRIDRAKEELVPIDGVVPVPSKLPHGCAFEPRCKNADILCMNGVPPFVEIDENCSYACFYPSLPN